MPTAPDRTRQPFAGAAGKQSRTMSLVEAVTNVVVGYVVAVLTQFAVFPVFGLVASVADNLTIGAVFTSVSIVRSYFVRRLFEVVRVRARQGSQQCGHSVDSPS